MTPFVVSFFFQNILFYAPALGSWDKILMFDPKTFSTIEADPAGST
jgi:hypothetical protein